MKEAVSSGMPEVILVILKIICSFGSWSSSENCAWEFRYESVVTSLLSMYKALSLIPNTPPTHTIVFGIVSGIGLYYNSIENTVRTLRDGAGEMAQQLRTFAAQS